MRFRDHQHDQSTTVPAPPTPATPNPLHAQADQLLNAGDDVLDAIVDNAISEDSRQFLHDVMQDGGQ